MCGIFGRIGSPLKNLDQLWYTAIDTEHKRGGHAYGWAWINVRGELHSYKAPGRLIDNEQDFEMLYGAVAVVGHCRWATHGSAELNFNNHPHACDDGYIVHNGVIHNYRQIAKDNHLKLQTQCDSEVIARFVEKQEGGYAQRLCRAIEPIMGNCAVAGVWGHKVYLARKGNPLHYSRMKGAIYFASLGEHLPGKPESYRDYQVTTIKVPNIKVEQSRTMKATKKAAKVEGKKYAAEVLF